ncbi:MAG: hypothetical protein J2P21_10455 [Chloracidobacterium sp.]|nr:hypothetical protein [Chloracidobacterium sp.]
MTSIETITDKSAPSAKFSITAQVDGFPHSVEVADGADRMLAVIDPLSDIGPNRQSHRWRRLLTRPTGPCQPAPFTVRR